MQRSERFFKKARKREIMDEVRTERFIRDDLEAYLGERRGSQAVREMLEDRKKMEEMVKLRMMKGVQQDSEKGLGARDGGKEQQVSSESERRD